MSYLKNELSSKSKYWISKERRLELVHFCLQYEERKRLAQILSGYSSDVSSHELSKQYGRFSTVEEKAVLLADICKANELIETVARDTDSFIFPFLLESVTTGVSFPKLRIKYNIPCGGDYFYARYRKFFYLLSEAKGV